MTTVHTLHQTLYNKLSDVLRECKDGQLAEVCALAKIELENRVQRAMHDVARLERELEAKRLAANAVDNLAKGWKP